MLVVYDWEESLESSREKASYEGTLKTETKNSDFKRVTHFKKRLDRSPLSIHLVRCRVIVKGPTRIFGNFVETFDY